MAAERSATGKTSRERCLCSVLSHMSGLLECHAELRDSLLRAGGGDYGGGYGGGGGGYGGGVDRVSLRSGRGADVSGGRRAWRQRPAAAVPVQRMLVVLRAESWPAFDQPEVEELERRILDEAAKLFAEVVAGRRAAGQRTYELTDGAAATLDSPGTRVWAQVLGEVQRRTGGHESDVVLRCEGVRRREAERFRRAASAQTIAFLQDLAASVGCSDNQWSVVLPPSCATATPPPAAVAVRRTATAGTGSSRTPASTRQAPPLLPLSPPLPPPDRAHVRGAPGASRPSAVSTPGISESEVCAAAQSPEAAAKNASDGEEEPRQAQPERAVLDPTGPDGRHDSSHAGGGGYCAANDDAAGGPHRERSAPEVEVVGGGGVGARRTERRPLLSSVDFGRGRQRLQGRDKDDGDGPRGRLSTAGSLEPAAPTTSPPPPPNGSVLSSAPLGGVAEAARGGASAIATTASACVPATTSSAVTNPPDAGITMTSVAKVLLARAGVGSRGNHGRSGSTASPSPPPPPPHSAEPQDASSKQATSARGGTEPVGDEVVVREDDGSPLERTNSGETERARPRGRPEEGARAAGRNGPNGIEASPPPPLSPPRVYKRRTCESPARQEHSAAPFRALLPAGDSEKARPVSPVSPTTGAPAPTAVDSSGSPAAGQQRAALPHSEGVRRGDTIEAGRMRTTGTGGGEEGGGGGAASAVGTAAEDGSSSEATRRLLQEALRVKRLLAQMDKEDAAAGSSSAAAVDNGLRDEDPERFLASLGLVELKPLSARLVEALERAPQAIFGDPSAAVSEPRTTRGLRDQVRGNGCR